MAIYGQVKCPREVPEAASYVLTNQTLDGLIDENGYTDAIASVSINLYGFVNGVNACLEQAAQ